MLRMMGAVDEGHLVSVSAASALASEPCIWPTNNC